ncbi:predicted protein [Plenodomus lingam JN3]|uniref:Predicted protein n=1 Tax=Leptosphaeria maculans (strain JN3 / isolate v23.1.3 / race Av1-4-5-6-7-8) TaxID=985895 RepID=E5A0I0_LEPMJ|nr:predicted protein [Plenodomus lingam JN3]CBX97040.1 predicted protein [Plenodomus lingam JN3]
MPDINPSTIPVPFPPMPTRHTTSSPRSELPKRPAQTRSNNPPARFLYIES